MSLGIEVNRNKIGGMLEYISSRIPNVSLRKLLKIIYLIDEKAVEERAFPITWLDYYAWEKGPVSPEVYEVKNGAFSDFVYCKRAESDNKWCVFPKKNAAFLIDKDMNYCSQWEINLIERVVEDCKNKTAYELTDETHRPESLWYKVVTNNKIDFSQDSKTDYLLDFNSLNEGNQLHLDIYEDALDSVYMQSLINKESCFSQAR